MVARRSWKRLRVRELRTKDSSSLEPSFAAVESLGSSDGWDGDELEQGILKSNSLSSGLGK